MPRPSDDLTIEDIARIQTCAGLGMGVGNIARILLMSESTLYRKLRQVPAAREALESGRAVAEAAVRQALYDQARRGNVPAIIWWEKTRLGLKEPPSITEIEALKVLTEAGWLPPEFAKVGAAELSRMRDRLRSIIREEVNSRLEDDVFGFDAEEAIAAAAEEDDAEL